jgi:iron complex transport system permease protein
MRARILFFLSAFIIVTLFVANIFWGATHIAAADVWSILTGNSVKDNDALYVIVLQFRLPQALVALLSGAAIALSGLLLQTAFRNPLADPGIMGISSGAGLGVALVMLASGTVSAAMPQQWGLTGLVVMGAFLGACLALLLLLAFASTVKNNVMLLITGLMLSYVTSSAVTLLRYFSDSESVYAYAVWGMANFAGVPSSHLLFYSLTLIAGIFLSILLLKPLNALLLGEQYARNLGVNTRRLMLRLLLCAGFLTAITTAYCGPVAFIGLAMPQLARLLLRTSNHKTLMPFTVLLGAAVALFCNLLCNLPETTALPLNALTPLFGAPVILYVIVNERKLLSTNQ